MSKFYNSTEQTKTLSERTDNNMQKLYYSFDQFFKANAADVVDYLIKKGYDCVCEGENEKTEYKFPELNSLSINTKKANIPVFCFRKFKFGGAGSVNCLMQALGMSYETAVSELLKGEAPKSKKPYMPKSILSICQLRNCLDRDNDKMPPRGKNAKRVYAYLIKDCGISAGTVKKLIKENYLYQDDKGNAVFVIKREGNDIGGDIRGTIKGKKYNARVRNTRDGYFEYPLSNAPKTAFVFKNVIDLTRFLDTHKGLDDCTLVAMDGLVDSVMESLSARKLDIVLCLDDKADDKKFYAKHSEAVEMPLDEAAAC